MAGNTTDQRPRGPGRPFQKGQSGNPNGRPKIVRTVQEMAREYGDEAIRSILALARGSDDDRVKLAAWREILDRAYGKAPVAVQHTGADGSDLVINVLTNVPRNPDDPQDYHADQAFPTVQ